MNSIRAAIPEGSSWLAAEQNAFVVGHIGGPLNQSSEKAVQLESSGGAR